MRMPLVSVICVGWINQLMSLWTERKLDIVRFVRRVGVASFCGIMVLFSLHWSYIEKKKSIPKIKTLRKELSESQSSGLRISKQSSSSDSDKSIDNQQVAISIQQEDKDDSLSVTLIPFLQSRCRIVDPIIVSCDFIAKLVFHDSYFRCNSHS